MFNNGLVNSLNIPLNPEMGDRVQNYFDTAQLVRDTSEYAFLAEPERKITRDNFKRNPLPTDKERVVVGLGLALPQNIVQDGNGLDAIAFSNSVGFGTLKATVGQDDTTVLERPVPFMLAASQIMQTDNGGVKENIVVIESRGIVPVSQQFYLQESGVINVSLHLDDSSGLGTNSNARAIQCVVQVAEGKHLVKRIRAYRKRSGR